MSADGATWDAPWPLPLNSIFKNIAPALLADAEGTIWLAWFSNRLHLETLSSGGYRLFLASSRDGRTWSRPRPIRVHPSGGWPMGGVQMLRDPQGRCRMFWRRYAGSADTVDGITELQSMDMPVPEGRDVWNPHVSIDGQGRFHMVFDNFGRGLWYSTSDRGERWSKPVELLPEEEGGGISHGQLVIGGERVALIYETNKGAWLRRGSLADLSALAEPVKITHHVIPLSGARLHPAGDGEVALLAGQDTVWLLRGKIEDVVGVKD